MKYCVKVIINVLFMAGFRKLYIKGKCLPIEKYFRGKDLELLRERTPHTYMAFTLNLFHKLPDWNSV